MVRRAFPDEIEDALCRHPSVLEASIVGRPDPLFGEEPVAFVVLCPGLTAQPDELIEHCKNVLAKFKVPRDVFIEANLPRAPIGKGCDLKGWGSHDYITPRRQSRRERRAQSAFGEAS